MPAIHTAAERNAAIQGKTLVFIGTANWDTYAQPDGRLWAIPKADCLGCHMSPFGDRHHILKLMRKGAFDDAPTAAGLALMEGLYSQIITPPNGKAWAMLAFSTPPPAPRRRAA